MRQRLRRIAWCLVILTVLGAVVCIILPESVARSRRSRIVGALATARSVRVEEFQERTILTTHELDATQRASLIQVVPTIVGRGVLPFSLLMCFVPHHRIIATDTDGVAFVLEICFSCDQAQHTGSPIYDMSRSGSMALRQLFKQYGVRVDDRDE